MTSQRALVAFARDPEGELIPDLIVHMTRMYMRHYIIFPPLRRWYYAGAIIGSISLVFVDFAQDGSVTTGVHKEVTLEEPFRLMPSQVFQCNFTDKGVAVDVRRYESDYWWK